MSEQVARKHHYVPAFYLAGFTDSGERDGLLHVVDTLEAKRFSGTPRSIGFEIDFYRIEHPELEPDVIEKALAQIESELAPALHRIRQRAEIPVGDDLGLLLNLIGLMGARVPGVRRAFEDPLTRVGEDILTILMQSPERYERFLKQEAAEGKDISGYPSFERIKEGWETGAFEVGVNPNWFPVEMLRLGAMIVDLLAMRDWSVVVADPDRDGGFITSDRPVSIHWTVPVPAFYGPGFGMPDTVVLFPVSARVALLGRFEADPEVVEATPKRVGFVNSHTTAAAERFLYGPAEDFNVLLESGELEGAKALLSALRSGKDGGEGVAE